MAQFDWSMLHNALAFQNMQRILQFRARPDLASNKYKSLKSGKPSYLYPSESVQDGNKAKSMAAPLLAVNSLLPSQSLFNEIQSIHETGFFHELDSFFKETPATVPTQVCKRVCQPWRV